MTDKRKSTVLRPKVRFSQSAESPNSNDDAQLFSKPKIRSIVDLKGPKIKIIKAPSADFDKGYEKTNFIHSAGDSPNELRLCPLKSTGASAPCLTEIIVTPENHDLRTKNINDIKEKSKIDVAQIFPSKSCIKEIGIENKHFLLQNNQNASKSAKKFNSITENNKQLRQVSKVARNNSQTRQSTNRKGKENICTIQKSEENVPIVPNNSPRSNSDVGIKNSEISKINATKVCQKKKEILSKTKEISINKKQVKMHTETGRKSMKEIGLMPCMKTKKCRSKSAPIKKTILRDASSSRSNFYVGPGVTRKNSPEQELRVKDHRSRSEILSGDKLARPEYNSIIGTIKKWQNLREEKVIKDLEHLPAVYKDLVNGKVSNALDFGANEAIYKNLVDLSIDEKQLPSRLTRSKDPEPRQKDLVPNLTDFFVPTNNEEYRKAVIPTPPNPRILDIFNPYKISDRIFAWKESLDHDL